MANTVPAEDHAPSSLLASPSSSAPASPQWGSDAPTFADLLKKNMASKPKLDVPVMSIPAGADKKKPKNSSVKSKKHKITETVEQQGTALFVKNDDEQQQTPPAATKKEESCAADQLPTPPAESPVQSPQINVWKVRIEQQQQQQQKQPAHEERVLQELTTEFQETSIRSDETQQLQREPRDGEYRRQGGYSPRGRGRPRGRGGYYSQRNYYRSQYQMMPYSAVDPETLRVYLLGQIEYYFSVENLCKDIYFRQQMDAEGFVKVELIAGFNRVKSLTTDLDFVKETIAQSQILEVNDDKVRKRENWQIWLLPASPAKVPANTN